MNYLRKSYHTIQRNEESVIAGQVCRVRQQLATWQMMSIEYDDAPKSISFEELLIQKVLVVQVHH
jgi:hypothetical protein